MSGNSDANMSINSDTKISVNSDTNISGNPYTNTSEKLYTNTDKHISGNTDINLMDYKSFFSYECTVNKLIIFFDIILYGKKKLNDSNLLNIPYTYMIYGESVEEIRFNKNNIDIISNSEKKIENIIEKYFF
jgi:hypothetical protein